MEIKKETQNHDSEYQDSNNQKFAKPIDYYYPDDYKEKVKVDSDLPSSLLNFMSIVGQDFSRRYNYHFFNNSEMLIANANTFQIINIDNYNRKIYHTSENGAVGAVCIHPNNIFFAVAECGDYPNIYIYEFPSMRLYRILRKGTEKSYSSISFNSRGDMIASVGGDPDYNLVIWNWVNESIILKAKAFSQEILNVQFSSNIEGKLITSGIGHIKFWEMANTFTGLKLQGELGKFGQIDLSDISAFVEFPDGKVLCGTEYGSFLLWEGIFIKAQIMIEEHKKCHENYIEYMSWDILETKYIPSFQEKFTEEATTKIRAENRNSDDYFESQEINERINDLIAKITIPEKITCILTGGYDGYLKWWIFSDFENANIDDNSNAYISPAIVKKLVNPTTQEEIKVANLVKLNDFWVVQDANGYLFKLTFVYENKDSVHSFDLNIQLIYNFISGPIIKIKNLHPTPYILIQGQDSNTYLYNLQANNFLGDKILLESNIGIKTSACDIAQRENEYDILIMAVGYEIGMLRIYQFINQSMKLNLLMQLRVHEEPIKKVLFSPDKSYLLTQTKSEIFVFIIDDYNKIIPFCSIKKTCNIIETDWNPDSKKFLIGLSDGSVEEIEIPLNFDNSKTFLMTEYKYKKYVVKLAENQLEKEEEKSTRKKNEKKKKKEPAPSSIISCKYINLYKEGDFIITAQKPFNEYLYLCNFNNDYYIENQDYKSSTPRPVTFWKLPKPMDYSIKLISKSFVILSNTKGHVHIRSKALLDKYVEIFPNSYSCSVFDINLSEDEKLVSVSYKDGTIINYSLNIEFFNQILQNIKNDPFNFDATKALASENNQTVKLAYEEIDNPFDVIKLIKNNDYESIQENAKNKTKEELEQIISLEKEKKEAEEKEKFKKAEETKNQQRLKIKKLQDDFQKVIVQNMALNEEVRLSEEELIVDDLYLDHIKNLHRENLDDIRHKYDWMKANIQVTIDKIKSFFLDSVKTTKIYVFALQSNSFVNTLRCPNLPSNFKETLAFINSEISELQRRIDFEVLDNEYKKYLPNENDVKENAQDTEKILNKIRSTIQDYHDNENRSEEAFKSAEMNKNYIKQELEKTNDLRQDLNKIISIKDKVEKKVKDFITEQKERGKKDKRGNRNQNFSNNVSKKVIFNYISQIIK